MRYSETETTARDYYNSDSADRFYEIIWGGEDIHIGLYEHDEETIEAASRRTVETMAGLLPGRGSFGSILDIGAGYGGAARFLARRYGCKVTCLNLSETQNQTNRSKNHSEGLDDLIDVVDGSFEQIPFPGNSYDMVWSQDAILHSGEREKVLAEVDRVLKPGGYFIFTDPMQSDGAPVECLAPVLRRIHLNSLGSPGFYNETARKLGWSEIKTRDYSRQLVNHYSRVLREVENRREELPRVCEPDYIERMKLGLRHWIDAGANGHLKWGIFLFRKSPGSKLG